ncbi:B3 domain-containing transcription factor VRN1-like isoform X2 [Humulus lupulus]|uniref:B3 domain-containing transcription factor VRN1-like isoform X2 n=1 Tax=Humulus lupulus TaxID=3486 RepID=UPI002B40A406|nr:B3 domain-containing transcription factor VRN1-like isoform X2 [Humulus lupulus]
MTCSSQRNHFTPTKPHFFKIILEQTLANTNLQIPKTFWMKYCGSLSSQVILKLPCGSRWELGLTKSDGKIWIEKGWNKFAEHYSLSRGNLLVFQYEGNSMFNVIIFDKSTAEIDYPSNPNHFEKHGIDIIQSHSHVGNKDDVSIEVLGSYPKTRDKSPLQCPQPHKKRKTSSCGKSKVKFDIPDQVCGESPLPRWMEPEFFLSKQRLSAKEKAEALQRAKGFKSKDPFFMVSMRPSFVGDKAYLIIPSMFANNYLLNKHQDVILKVQDGRTWSVKYSIRQYKGSSSKITFECGWKAFAQDNELKVDDVCAFVLRSSTGIILFEVVIFCENGVAKSPMLLELAYTTAIEGASCSQSERPSFTVTMHETYATGHSNLYLPYKFVEKYINKNECEVRLWVSDGRSWFVPLKVRQANGFRRAELLCCGWKAFMLDNSLRKGDICTFELTNNGNEISFRVTFVKGAADDAYNKQVATKRRATTNPCVKVESSFNYGEASMISQNQMAKKEQENIKVEPFDKSMKVISEANTGNQGTANKRPSSSGLCSRGASEAANQFFTKNPYFQVVLQSNHAYGNKLPIPIAFMRQYLEEKSQTMTLWVGEKYRHVKLLAGPPYTFSAGWAAFATDNSLQPRDVCIFELIKRNQHEMKVTIFRQSDLAQD